MLYNGIERPITKTARFSLPRTVDLNWYWSHH